MRRRRSVRELVEVERFPVEAEVSGLSEEWAARALEALRLAVVSRNEAGEERDAETDEGWLTRDWARLEM
jgi:hypothetical protein